MIIFLIKTLFSKVGSSVNLDSMMTYFEHLLVFQGYEVDEFVTIAKGIMADQTSVTADQWLRFEKVWNKLKELWRIFKNILAMQPNSEFIFN